MTGLVLAAGRGQRLGGVNKAALEHEGESYLARIARVAQAAGCERVAVVAGGPFLAEVSEAAQSLDLDLVENPVAERGMSSSVARGFAWLQAAGRDAALLWPVDHAFAQESTVKEVMAALPGHLAVIPTFEQRGGHPVAIDAGLFAELAQCESENEGARSVLRRHADSICRLAVDDAGILRDVDRPEDLK